ncbi:MAG: NAD(P)-dependent alcohol dehydrogenase [Caldilineaceae bacterium]|nr:NAD(P)-dependent alcohol dehydrogenase [Caldilineaceae bacterium]
MQAIVWTQYGSPDVLKLREVPKPAPKSNEILIKIHATTATTGDCEMRNLRFPYWIRLPMRLYLGLRKPTRVTIPGTYLAGEVEAIGADVSRFSVGDQVFGTTLFGFGTYAEYVCVPEKGAIAPKPAAVSYEAAAPVGLGGLEALHFLTIANIQSGEKVLINGAGGSIGTYGIQIAKHFGAEVTAVDSGEKLKKLRQIGADGVIDYTQQDFSQNGQHYDVIFDIIGKSPFSASVRSLNPNGRYLIANPTGLIQVVRGKLVSRNSDRKVLFEMTSPKAKDLAFLAELMEAGKLHTVIDRCYPLAQIADAHRYVETGQKVGNVIITTSPHADAQDKADASLE